MESRTSNTKVETLPTGVLQPPASYGIMSTMDRHLPWAPEYRTYSTNPRAREPLVQFMVEALRDRGCRVIFASEAHTAPFRITFETPEGERMGIIAYAFLITFTPTKNRPPDEWSFQIKYGEKRSDTKHELWQDPLGLYTTVLIGIDPGRNFFVAADPVVHNPTKFHIRLEFKQEHVDAITTKGWEAWERQRRSVSDDRPIEVLVGGTKERFLDLVRFEREVVGEDQGHRMLLAERMLENVPLTTPDAMRREPQVVSMSRIHALAREFDLSEAEVLDLISHTPRMKMAVRGGVAELHLHRVLEGVPGVTECERLVEEGSPDVRLRFRGSRPIFVECKNALRKTTAQGEPRVDFQRTRASKADACSRFYSPRDFDVLAVCLHALTERWEFRFHQTHTLAAHRHCEGKLDNNVRVGKNWSAGAEAVLAAVAAA